jgi:hypothetical protein
VPFWLLKWYYDYLNDTSMSNNNFLRTRLLSTFDMYIVMFQRQRWRNINEMKKSAPGINSDHRLNTFVSMSMHQSYDLTKSLSLFEAFTFKNSYHMLNVYYVPGIIFLIFNLYIKSWQIGLLNTFYRCGICNWEYKILNLGFWLKTPTSFKCTSSLRNYILSRIFHHLTPVKMAIIKGNNNNKYWWGCGKTGTLIHCWWEYKLLQPLWNCHMIQRYHSWASM